MELISYYVIGCGFSWLEHVSDCGCFVTGEGTKCADVQTDPVVVLPVSSCHNDSSSSSVPDMIHSNSNQGSSDGCARSRRARRRLRKNCTCDKWERIWCSRSSLGLIPTLKIFRRCSRQCRNSASSCQPVNQSKQHTLPNESLGTSFKSRGHLVESRSAARRSSHSSECERSGSNRCRYRSVREVSVSRKRQWYHSDIADRSRGDSEMSAKKHGSSSRYDRSRQMSRGSSDISECERSDSNRCRYRSVRDVSVSRKRQWYHSDTAIMSKCKNEMSAKKHASSAGYDRSRQISRSSCSSECERSDSNRCRYRSVRDVSVSCKRQWYHSDIADTSRCKSEMLAKKHASSAGYDRSRQISCSSHSSNCDISDSNRCHYRSVREASVSRERQWCHSDIALASKCKSEMSVTKDGSSVYNRSRQISLSEEHSGNFSHTHVAAVNHSFSHRSANVTIRQRAWQYTGSHVSASGSMNRILERSSTRNWQQMARYGQDLAGRPLLPPVPHLPPPVPYLPSSLNFAVPWTFPRLFPFFVPFLLLPTYPIPIPLWR